MGPQIIHELGWELPIFCLSFESSALCIMLLPREARMLCGLFLKAKDTLQGFMHCNRAPVYPSGYTKRWVLEEASGKLRETTRELTQPRTASSDNRPSRIRGLSLRKPIDGVLHFTKWPLRMRKAWQPKWEISLVRQNEKKREISSSGTWDLSTVGSNKFEVWTLGNYYWTSCTCMHFRVTIFLSIPMR